MNWKKLEKKTGFTFKDKRLLKQAFVHRSYLNETKQKLASNERLEFLGDAVLSFVTSSYLYKKYPQLPEGMLTNIRSSIVKTESLAAASESLNLGTYLFLSRGEEDGGGRTNQSLLADVFEAFLGALFLDQGIGPVQALLQTVLFSQIPGIIKNKAYVDFKSRLQEEVQETLHISPTYKVIKTQGKDHEKTFWIEALIKDTVAGKGKGRSKQEAEQHAAQNALEKRVRI